MLTIDDHIDVSICSLEYFQRLLKDHVPWAVAFVYYPPCGIILESVKLEHQLEWRQLKRALTLNCTINLNQAAAFWRHGDEYRSRKRVFFVLQMTIFSTQLVVAKRIVDFWEEPNSLRHTIFDPKLKTSWNDFKAVWRPLYDYYVDRFVALRNAFRFRELEFLSSAMENRIYSHKTIEKLIENVYSQGSSSVKLYCSSSTANPLANEWPTALRACRGPNLYPTNASALVTRYIREHDVSSLRRDLAIRAERHPQHPNLIQLYRTPGLTPSDSIIGSECNGIILNSSNNAWNVVAFAHHHVFAPEDSSPVLSMDSSSSTPLKVYNHIDAPLMMLFWYEKSWLVASSASPNGAEFHSRYSVPYSDLFWQLWNQSGASLDILDKSKCYSFYMLHPMARKRILYVEPKLLLRSVSCWMDTGLVEDPLEQWTPLLPFELLINLNIDNHIQSRQDAEKKIPLGGLVLQHGEDPWSQIYLTCSYHRRLNAIEEFHEDLASQELEMLFLLVEQAGNVSCFDYPLDSSRPLFEKVNDALTSLLKTLDSFRPRLAAMSQDQLRAEAEKLGDLGHFVYLMKVEGKECSSSAEVLKLGCHTKRIRSYLITWWKNEHSTAPPRINLQNSYKC